MADNTTELEVLDEIVDVLGGQSGQYETVVPVLQQIKELLAAGITDPEAIAEAVAAWLDEHPEATTTVQDGSITDKKLVQTGGVLSEVHDVRTGVGGREYASAGDAVRGQIEWCSDVRTDTYSEMPYIELDERPITAELTTNIEVSKTALQLVVGGHNLLVHPYFRPDTYTIYGVTFTVAADGSITANGTATNNVAYNVNYYNPPHWIPSGFVYLSGCTGGSSDTYYLIDQQGGHVQYDAPVRTQLSDVTSLNIVIVIKSGVTVTDQVFRPMLSTDQYAEYDSPAKLYTAQVESGATEYTWSGITFRDGYNLIIPQRGDRVTAIVTYFHKPRNQWKGRKWVAFGTSITDNYSPNAVITQGDHAGEPTGKYVPYLLEMSELSTSKFVNRGIAGGCINGHILYYLRYYTLNMVDADLITIEGAVNDFASAIPLGQVGDTVPYTSSLLQDGTADGTFAGACYQAFTTAIANAPNAVVVMLTETTGRDIPETGAHYAQTAKNALGLYQSDYIEMTKKVAEFVGIPVINCGRDSMINAQNPQYIADNIHHTYLGGKQYATAIWDKLQGISLKAL